jgi:hypothetical protein
MGKPWKLVLKSVVIITTITIATIKLGLFLVTLIMIGYFTHYT